MKSTRYIIAIGIAFLSGMFTLAQTQDPSKAEAAQTITFKVKGNCEMCKSRIEKAAKVNGVGKAIWDQKTKDLSLVYYPSVVTVDAVQKKIAAAGHDTEKFRADDKAYNALPACCHYR
jgi:membrane-bound lytic murein transglycosylase B